MKGVGKLSEDKVDIYDLLGGNKKEAKKKREESKKKPEKKKTKKKKSSSKGFRELTTNNDYLLQEVVSALIKEIRRNHPMRAMFWAEEMARSGFHKYMWRRLLIAASEEVGTANNEILPLVIAARESYYLNQKSASKQQPLGHAILALCESAKNRVVDDFLVTFRIKTREGDDGEGWKPEIPDYALDMHTDKGRNKGRKGTHLIESSQVVDRNGAPKSEWWEKRKEKMIEYEGWGDQEFDRDEIEPEEI